MINNKIKINLRTYMIILLIITRLLANFKIKNNNFFNLLGNKRTFNRIEINHNKTEKNKLKRINFLRPLGIKINNNKIIKL